MVPLRVFSRASWARPLICICRLLVIYPSSLKSSPDEADDLCSRGQCPPGLQGLTAAPTGRHGEPRHPVASSGVFDSLDVMMGQQRLLLDQLPVEPAATIEPLPVDAESHRTFPLEEASCCRHFCMRRPAVKVELEGHMALARTEAEENASTSWNKPRKRPSRPYGSPLQSGVASPNPHLQSWAHAMPQRPKSHRQGLRPNF